MQIDYVSFIHEVLDNHNKTWEDLREDCRKYRDTYNVKFWNNHGGVFAQHQALIQTADAYASVESYVAGLFPKSPAVEIEGELKDEDAEKIEVIANKFLKSKSRKITDATRNALIYGHSYLKVEECASDELLESVKLTVVDPWEIILDEDAREWEDLRYAGHAYYLPIEEANRRYSKRGLNYTPSDKKDFFDGGNNVTDFYGSKGDVDFRYIFVVEFYDLLNDKFIIFSPSIVDKEKQILHKSRIPLRTYDDRPLLPFTQVIFAPQAGRQLFGLSAIGRIYSQVAEKNILRTFLANSHRKDVRQFIYKKSELDDAELSKLASGIDGALIGVEKDLNSIKPLEIPRTSPNIDSYNNLIEDDLRRSTIAAPFARGEATKATATEVAQLSLYTSSDIGRHAQCRDAAIKAIVLIYFRILAGLIEDKEVITVTRKNRDPELLSLNELNRKLDIYHVDGGNDPVSRNVKKVDFTSLIPTLVQLGVSPQKIKEELIRLYDLPPSFLSEDSEEEAGRVFNIDQQAADTQDRVALPTRAERGAAMALAGAPEEGEV